MNIMKRIINLCIVIIALIGLSGSAFGQTTNSGTTPAIGTTHSYWVNSDDGTALKTGYPTGNTYLWYITKGDLLTTNTSDFTIATGGGYIDGNSPVTDLYTIDITWSAASAGSTYYLHIIETATAAAGGCSNHKVEIIKPFSDFQLAIANVDEEDLGTEVAQDFANCAPNVTPAIVSDAIVYDYGTTTLYYKVVASNIDKAKYTFGYKIETTGGPTAKSATYGTVSGGTYTQAGTLTADGTSQIQEVTNAEKSSTIYIKVVLDNNQGDATTFANPFEGLTAHSVKVTLESGTQGAANAIITDGNDTTTDDDYRNQNISARPSTSGIGSN